MIFAMLLLSTSMAMAQFGDLEDIIRKAESENGNNGGNGGEGSIDSPVGSYKPNKGTINMSFIDNAIKDGFFLVKQEYRLEDVNIPGSRYDREGRNNFGEKVSFVLKLKNGLVASNQVVAPWETDPNFDDYKGGQYVPHMSRTSYLHVGKTEWKVADKMLDPETMKPENIKKDQGMAYLTEEAPADGFTMARGFGKKEVLVVWLSFSEGKDDANAQFTIKEMELDIEKGKTCNVPVQSKPNDAVCGIVVEPVYGVGSIELALVGVIDLEGQDLGDGEADKTCKMVLVRSLVGNAGSDSEVGSELAPSEGGKKSNNDKSSNKNKK